jgi:glycosyltransferase involved in cell wall biosynthesis
MKTRLLELLNNSYLEIKNRGITSFKERVVFYIKHKLLQSSFSFHEELEKWEKYNKNRPVNDLKKSNKSNARIAFLLPGVGISGGVAIILQHVNRLQLLGHDVEILSQSNIIDTSWFPNQLVKVRPYRETKKILKNSSLDILIASGWSTAYSVDMANAQRKLYFVQSDESRFFPEDPKLCELIRKTYSLPFTYFTEAHWIQKWLKSEFGHDSYYVPNGLDTNIFHPTEPIAPKGKKLRVLLEGPIDIPFKGMADAFNAVKDLDCEVWAISSAGKPKPEWRCDRFFEKVPMMDMAKIYSSCDIFLKMSRIEGFFGPPMEALVCGCVPVVGKVTGYDEYIINEKNALVVELGDVDGAKNAIERLIKDVDLRKKILSNAHDLKESWTWNRSEKMFTEMLSKI